MQDRSFTDCATSASNVFLYFHTCDIKTATFPEFFFLNDFGALSKSSLETADESAPIDLAEAVFIFNNAEYRGSIINDLRIFCTFMSTTSTIECDIE